MEALHNFEAIFFFFAAFGPSLENLESMSQMCVVASVEPCVIKARGCGGVSLFPLPLLGTDEKDMA